MIRIFKVSIFLFALAIGWLQPTWVAAATTHTTNGQAVVLKNSNLRAAPSISAPVIWWAASNDMLSVLIRSDGWFKIRTKYGKIGWIRSKNIRLRGVVSRAPLQHQLQKKRLIDKRVILPAKRLRPTAIKPITSTIDPSVKAALPDIKFGAINLTMDTTDARVMFRKDPFDNSSFPAQVQLNHARIQGLAKVKILGSSTRRFHKKSLLIKFQHALDGLPGGTRMTLHAMAADHSMMREYLAWNLMRRMGMVVPRVNYVKLTINGRYQGLFLSIGWIGKAMLQSDQLKAVAMFQPDDRFFCGDLMPSNIARTSRCWMKLFNREKSGYQPIRTLATKLNALDDQQFPSWLDHHFDLDSVIDWLVINTLLSNGDSYNKNYFMVLQKGGKWHLIPWDYDLSFGHNWEPYRKYPYNVYNHLFQYYYPPDSGAYNPLKDRLLANPMLRKRFVARLSEVMGLERDGSTNRKALFYPDVMRHRISQLEQQLQPEIGREPHFSAQNRREFVQQSAALRHFVAARHYYLRHLLQADTPWLPSGSAINLATIGDDQHGGVLPQGKRSMVHPSQAPLPHQLHGRIDRQFNAIANDRYTYTVGDPGYRFWLAAITTRQPIPVGADLHLSVESNQPPQMLPDGIPPQACLRRSWMLFSTEPQLRIDGAITFEYLEENSRRNELGSKVDESKLRLWRYAGDGWQPMVSHSNALSNSVTSDALHWNSSQIFRFVACSR